MPPPSFAHCTLSIFDSCIGLPEGFPSAFFGFFCHQDPSILLSVDGRVLALCPRCLGLHVGFSLAMIAYLRFSFIRHAQFDRHGAMLVLSAAAVAGLHWLLGYTGLMTMTPELRCGTGAMTGAALALLACQYARWKSGHARACDLPARNSSLALGFIIFGAVGYVLPSVTSWFFLTLIGFFSLCGSIVTVIVILLRYTGRLRPFSQSLRSVTVPQLGNGLSIRSDTELVHPST